MPRRAVHIILLSIILAANAFSPLSGQDAPVVSGGNITSAVAGATCTLPVTVDNFNDISQFTLTLKFDTTRVRFLSSSGIALSGTTVTYTPPSGNTQGKIVIAWNGGANYSLPTGTALVQLTYKYTLGTGLLSWAYTYGSVCQFKRLVSGIPTVLNDNPKYYFYRNGGISNRAAPVIYAPILPITSPGTVGLAVTTDAFTSIGAMTLYMEYDPAVITYLNTFIKNPAFGSTFQVGNTAGTGGKMYIVMQWYGNLLTLANGSTIVTLNFNYNGSVAGTELKWFDNIPSCEFADATDVLIDLPQTDYYHDGFAGPPLAADFTAGNLTPPRNSTVPFTDLSTGTPTSWLWSFEPPGVVFVNGTSILSQNPQVVFTNGGLYTVGLTVQNAYFSDSEIKTAYIRAGTAGLWTGELSEGWNTTTNWDNHLIPDAGTSVVIPPAAPNWPIFEGNFTIGEQCAGLTLSGTTSQMTVNGDLVITAP